MVLAACSFEGIWGLSFGAILSFLPVFMTSTLGSTATMVGIVISTRFLLNGVLMYPYGWLADRMNRVHLVIVGAVITAAGTFAVPWMTTFISLLVLMSIIALLESMAVPATNAIVVERGRELGMGSVMGIFNMFMGIGLLVGSVAGGLIQDLLGVGNVFRFAAVFILGGASVFYTLMKRGQ
jgi:MFS family permease